MREVAFANQITSVNFLGDFMKGITFKLAFLIGTLILFVLVGMLLIIGGGDISKGLAALIRNLFVGALQL